MPHLDSIQDPGAWTKFGVKKLSQVIHGEQFSSFAEMRQCWNIPRSYTFRYMQLVHALSAQFSEGAPQLIELGLEQMVRKRSEKKSISNMYTYLSRTTLSDISKLCKCWKRNVPNLVEGNSEEIWRFPFQILVSLRDKLIQFQITHRSYYTPYKLYKISPINLQNCWRSADITGNFIHIFWRMKIVVFWREVLRIIAIVTSVSLEQEAEICRSGLVGKNITSTGKRTQVGLFLFYARNF